MSTRVQSVGLSLNQPTNMYEGDTISAISTPLGKSGIGIVRLSGPDSITIANRLFSSPHDTNLRKVKSHTLHYGFIRDPENGKKVDEVLISIMKSPKTYTREDIAEINCHGGIVPLRKTLELTFDQGARPAEPGEFTKRAFLNGRITLDQAKSVKDLIDSKTQLSLELAVKKLEGKFSEFLAEMRDELTSILAKIEVAIDFPDYEESMLSENELRNKLSRAKRKINRFLNKSKDGKILKEGHKTAILGRPNVGKSTLLNKLLKEERAIVSATPGTTRDVIEEEIEINGIPLVITDTAGIRHPENEVEELGVTRAKEQGKKADISLFLMDITKDLGAEDLEIADELDQNKTIIILNKADLEENLSKQSIVDTMGNNWVDIIPLSAKKDSGLDSLEKTITEVIWGGRVEKDESTVLLDVKEKNLLKQAKVDLDEALTSLNEGRPVDLVEVHIRSAREKLGKLLGEDLPEQILDKVFSDFCVGK